MEVSCSASDQAQEFCTKHNVDGFPTIKLMGGKLKKALLFERDRSVQVSKRVWNAQASAASMGGWVPCGCGVGGLCVSMFQTRLVLVSLCFKLQHADHDRIPQGARA